MILTIDFFHHRSFERAWQASNAYEILKGKDLEVTVESSETIYKGFLNRLISDGYPIEGVSSESRNVLVDEAYKRSNFDWKDKEKFGEFYTWLCKAYSEHLKD